MAEKSEKVEKSNRQKNAERKAGVITDEQLYGKAQAPEFPDPADLTADYSFAKVTFEEPKAEKSDEDSILEEADKVETKKDADKK